MLKYIKVNSAVGIRELLTRGRQDSNGRDNEGQDSKLHFSLQDVDRCSRFGIELIDACRAIGL